MTRTIEEALTFLMREAGLPEEYIAWALEQGQIQDSVLDILRDLYEQDVEKGKQALYESYYNI